MSESECDTPDWSYSGATTQTWSDSARAISSQTLRPGAWMPSSLVTRMRMMLLTVSRLRREVGDAKLAGTSAFDEAAQLHALSRALPALAG